MEDINKVYGNLISNEEWQIVVSKKLSTSQFTIQELRIRPLSNNQLGSMGEHLRIDILVRLPGATDREVLHFFAKSVPIRNEFFRRYVDQLKSFHKEISYFSLLLPDLQKYVTSGTTKSFCTCECYLSKPEILVMEDLVNLGFQQIEGRKPMDYDHCVLMLQTLGRFHAASIVFEENQGIKIIDKYRDVLYETEWVMTEGHLGYEFLQSSIKGMLSLLDYIPKYGKNYEDFKLVMKRFPTALEQICEYVKPSTKFRNVLCHGDLWASNMFFRYDGIKNKPVEAKLIDFQLVRYNPPACDVICFLHLVTLRQFREEHLEEFLTVYYRSLTAELKRNNLDVGQLLPWSEFKESCDFYRNAGRTMALLCFQQCLMTRDYLKKLFSDADHVMKFQYDKSEYLIECYKSDPLFRIRNTEAIEEFIEHCILRDYHTVWYR